MKKFTILLLLIIAQTAFGQSFSVFNVDASGFLTIKAKFWAFDAAGNPITNLNNSDFEINENGTQRNGIVHYCPPVQPPKALSSVLVMDVSGSMGWGAGTTINMELAKAAARAWVNALPLGNSECAISTFDHYNYINQDFTTDRSKLLTAINGLNAMGGTDYNAALISPVSGGLLVSKNGKYQRVIVMLTDGQASTPQIENIVSEANRQQCIIYTVTLGMACPQSLKDIATRTGGQAFENVTTVQEAENIYRTILQIAQGGEPCSIEWQSGVSCTGGLTNAEIKLISQNLTANLSYQRPNTAVAKLEFNPTSLQFANPQVGVITPPQTVTVTARNTDFTINNITTKIPVGFDIAPKNFPITLRAGESMDFTVTYFPADSGYNHCKFDVDCVPCATKFYVSGGWKGKKPTIRTIKLIHPNGGEVFIAGFDTVITWEGISPEEPVTIKYSIDNGVNWIPIADTATGLSYTWRVPKTPSDQCLAIVTATAKSILNSDIEMVPIPAGTFQMGNTGTDSGRDIEKPIHTVTISKAFYMSKYEITQKQYEAVMGNSPSKFKGENHPVEQVSWYNAVAFCNKLSELEGLEQCYTINGTDVSCNWDANGYRLPTEAEWEYACKAGTTTDFYNGNLSNGGCSPIDANLDNIAWYCGNANNTTHSVGQKQPNAFGLYDMSGNVLEWCWDCYSSYSSTALTDPSGASTGFYRVFRGGCWSFNARSSRGAYRYYDAPSYNNDCIGFRIVSPS